MSTKVADFTVGSGTQSATKVSLNALPPEAWRIIFGGDGKEADKRPVASVAYLYRAYTLRVNAIAGAPYEVYAIGAEEPIWTDQDGAPPDALAYLVGFQSLLRHAAASLCLYGRSYWQIERNLMRTLRLRPLAPQSVRPDIDPIDGLKGFKRTHGGAIVDLDVDDVVYIWPDDPATEVGPPAMYPMSAAWAASSALRSLDQYMTLHFDRGLLQVPLITTTQPVTPENAEILKSWFGRIAQGVKGAFKPAVVSGSDTSVTMLGGALSEIANGELTRQLRQDIAAAFGVPPSLIMADAANFATARQDWLTFYETTVLGDCELIAAALNEQLLNRFGYEMRFAPERLEAFQAAELQKSEGLQRLTGRPIMTLNEARERLELAPVPDGDIMADAYATMQAAATERRQPVAEVRPPSVNVAQDVTAEVPAAKAMPAWDRDMDRFKRWYKTRLGADVAEFDSLFLAHADKVVAADALLRSAIESYP